MSTFYCFRLKCSRFPLILVGERRAAHGRAPGISPSSASLYTLTRFQVNRKSALDDLPEDLRQAMAASWWLASLADAHSAAYWRVSTVLHLRGLDSDA